MFFGVWKRQQMLRLYVSIQIWQQQLHFYQLGTVSRGTSFRISEDLPKHKTQVLKSLTQDDMFAYNLFIPSHLLKSSNYLLNVSQCYIVVTLYCLRNNEQGR